MPKPSARETVLDAYQDILIEHGPGSVTLDAVAAKANVSKGGLLYHFNSKEALLDGLLERLRRLSLADIEHAKTAPEGVVRYFLTSSVTDASMDKPAHRASMAALRQVGSDPRVTETIKECALFWREMVAEHIDDPLTAEIVGAIGDGLYLRATMGEETATLVDQLDEVLRRLGL
ncbi:TetR/AcrR family transcriptional regulator [Amycolatopsis magusensis]|uniref:AcrR family transcriptional regulator n=1 Tax=Amycolatopsis magusensis TaxID=882444 RepID=A0ABS4PKX1_9PSEU|nr:TetR/AcrR family transcriptional regulator [Amycolatopsis magusensis]MBP2180060.1 AcrR family transcriptional regulator [Amycolatopsis magusensis]MDI5977105.1 TetR/AcrR family transcriptional regulator [Amycolatopsis magusensis]